MMSEIALSYIFPLATLIENKALLWIINWPVSQNCLKDENSKNGQLCFSHHNSFPLCVELESVQHPTHSCVWFILNGSLLHIWKSQSAALRCGNASAINLEHVSQPGSLTLRWIWCEGTADTLQMLPRAVNLRPGAYDKSSLLFTLKKRVRDVQRSSVAPCEAALTN